MLTLSAALMGCSDAPTATGEPVAGPEEDLTAASKAALIAKIKNVVETAVKNESNPVFPGEKKASPSSLKGAALRAYKEYDRTTREGMINNGPPRVSTATVNGQIIFMVSGDVSDSGSESGYYTAKGTLLAMAYSGQGENPNANGVDWKTP